MNGCSDHIHVICFLFLLSKFPFIKYKVCCVLGLKVKEKCAARFCDIQSSVTKVKVDWVPPSLISSVFNFTSFLRSRFVNSTCFFKKLHHPLKFYLLYVLIIPDNNGSKRERDLLFRFYLKKWMQVSWLLQVSLRGPIRAGVDDAGLKEIISTAVCGEIYLVSIFYTKEWSTFLFSLVTRIAYYWPILPFLKHNTKKFLTVEVCFSFLREHIISINQEHSGSKS